MKNVLILGTGGCAAEITFYIKMNNLKCDVAQQINIKGYIEYADNVDKYYSMYQYDSPVVCDIDHYVPREDEEVLLAVADIDFRKKMIDKLLDVKANIGSFSSCDSMISKNAKMGIGNIIYPYCIVEPNAIVGDYNMLTSYSFISHDCIVGNNNFLSSAGLAGHIVVGDNNYFGIRSTVIPHIKIGNHNKIQAGMIVNRNIHNDSTIFYRFKEQVLVIPKPK